MDGQGPIDGEMLLGLGSVSSATGVVGRAEEPCSLFGLSLERPNSLSYRKIVLSPLGDRLHTLRHMENSCHTRMASPQTEESRAEVSSPLGGVGNQVGKRERSPTFWGPANGTGMCETGFQLVGVTPRD